MKVTAYRSKIIQPQDSLEQLLAETIPSIPERSVVAIVSKAFSFSENRFAQKQTGSVAEKHDLAKQESEYYLDASLSRYNLLFTIIKNWMWVNAGIDESNSDSQYTLWPQDPQKSVNKIWKFIKEHYGVKEVGVIMTDSKSIPLNWGVTGLALAHCGFYPLKDYRGTKDIFGRTMQMEQLSISQSIAAAACLEMGEGNERRPFAVASNFQQDIQWQERPPTQAELDSLVISKEDDVYAPLLSAVDWKKGGKN